MKYLITYTVTFFISSNLVSQNYAFKDRVDSIISIIENDSNSALSEAIILTNLANKSKNKFGQAKGYFIQGWIYDKSHIYDSAIINYLKAIEHAKNANYDRSKNDQISLLKNCGVIFRKTNYDSLALDFYLKALKIATEINDQVQLISLRFNMAGIYSDRENYQDGIALLQKNLRTFEIDKPTYFNNLARLAYLKYKVNEYDTAIIICERALSEKNDYLISTKFSFFNTQVSSLIGNNEEGIAKKMLDQYLSDFKDRIDPIKISSLLLEIANHHLFSQEYNIADSILRLSTAYLNKSSYVSHKYNSDRLDIYLKLSKANLRLNNLDQEQHYSKLYKQELESFDKKNRRLNMDLIVDRFNLGEAKRKQSIYYRNTIQWVLYSFGFLIIIGVVFNRFSQYKLKRVITRSKIDKKLAELKALKAQINPHFLFNSLNSIQAFILEGDEDNAEKYLSQHSKLMRKILNHSDKQVITLHEELETLELYISLERMRSGLDFKYTVQIDKDIDPLNLNVPSMVIQPFLENSIWHGISELRSNGELKVTFEENDKDEIIVTIEDNGKGIDTSRVKDVKNPHGMQLVKERLEILNTDNLKDDTIEIMNKDTGGVLIRFRFSNDL